VLPKNGRGGEEGRVKGGENGEGGMGDRGGSKG